MTCEGCVKDISEALYKLEGISNVSADLKDQLVRVEGTGTCSTHTPLALLASFIPSPPARACSHATYLFISSPTSLAPYTRKPLGVTTAGISRVGTVANKFLVPCRPAPPSAIVAAIEATGRDAILRGSGSSNSKLADTLNANTSVNRRHAVWGHPFCFKRLNIALERTKNSTSRQRRHAYSVCLFRRNGTRLGVEKHV